MSTQEFIMEQHPEIIHSLFGRMFKASKGVRPRNHKSSDSAVGEAWFVHCNLVVKVTCLSKFQGLGSIPSVFGHFLTNTQLVHDDETMCVFKYRNCVAIVAKKENSKLLERV